MKKAIFYLLVFTAATFTATAQKFSDLDKSPMDMIEYPSQGKEKLIRVLYSRPQLKGRSLNQLTPNGKVWRTGANEATEITFYTAMKLGETTIPAGPYSFYTIPNDGEWTVIINTDTHVWGAYGYDQSKDVARITVPVSKGKSLEALSMTFKEDGNTVNLFLGWDTLRLAVPFMK